MKTKLFHITIIIFLVILLSKAHAQNPKSTNFLDKIKAYDLSVVLTADSILTEDEENYRVKLERNEILGFRDETYQRFFIHFISVIQNQTNPYEYFAYGKTKIRDNICSFNGTITVKTAIIYDKMNKSSYKQGSMISEVLLYEDKTFPYAGVIKGKLTSNFIIDKIGSFRYNALEFYSDGFSNNQFVGTWTNYITHSTQKCNWGEYRIPECGDLDIGAGEFSINDKYLENGWQNYRLAWLTLPKSTESKQAKLKENEQWWK